ncbi:MAG: ABC transporter permease subunit [Nitrospirae bacterium]|nr:ABC transporter permease subunit [Nitrospirota bacterium]
MVFTEASRAIAWKELIDKLRNRWVIIVGLTFMLFTLSIAYLGAAPAGLTGFRRIDTTVASLTSLVTFFIPLMSLTLGGGIIAEERERGTLEIFLASPVSALEFITGKFLGLLIALTIALVAGLGLAGGMLALKSGIETLWVFARFVFNSLVLSIIFLSISFFISIAFYERTKVIALSVFLWLFYTIIYDLGLIGVVLLTKGEIGMNLFSALLLLNPVDVYRLMNFISIGEFKIVVGLASVEFSGYINTPILLLIALLWTVIPLGGGYLLFKRRYYE